jgi:hypothetical protein
VSTPAAALPSVSVGLEQVKTDIYQLFRTLSLGLDDAYARLEQIALAASDAAGVVTEQHAVAVRFRNATAAAMLGLTASVEDIDGQLTAMAEALLGVQVEVGNVSAGGLIQFKAQVPPPAGVLVQINIMARVTTGDAFKESGMAIQLYDDAGTIKSRIVNLADQYVIWDGLTQHLPFVFEAGVLKLAVARIGTAIIEKFQTPSGKTQIGVFGGGSEGLRLFT